MALLLNILPCADFCYTRMFLPYVRPTFVLRMRACKVCTLHHTFLERLNAVHVALLQAHLYHTVKLCAPVVQFCYLRIAVMLLSRGFAAHKGL